jgi:hypothetical protein
MAEAGSPKGVFLRHGSVQQRPPQGNRGRSGTKAMPIASGEVWTATPTGIALDGIRLRFT